MLKYSNKKILKIKRNANSGDLFAVPCNYSIFFYRIDGTFVHIEKTDPIFLLLQYNHFTWNPHQRCHVAEVSVLYNGIVGNITVFDRDIKRIWKKKSNLAT